jgi:hypothetical protein
MTVSAGAGPLGLREELTPKRRERLAKRRLMGQSMN